MAKFCAEFTARVPSPRKKGRRTTEMVEYLVEAKTYKDALHKSAPMADFLTDTTEHVWRLTRLREQEGDGGDPLHSLPPEYGNKYCVTRNTYQLAVVSGTNFLNIPKGKEARGDAYGALVRNMDTGEMTFACCNGHLYTHQEIREKKWPNVAEDGFLWRPVVFPLRNGSVIDFPYYVLSNQFLAFPIEFWGHESYDAQIEWIKQQEGLV